MSAIPQEQGAIKLSEIAADLAIALLATAEREDMLTVIEQTRKVLTDSLRRSGGAFVFTSRNAVGANPGTMAWTGTTITFGVNTSLVLKILQNESGNVVDLIATYGASNGAATFNSLPLASGEVLYVELDRTLLPMSGSLVLENAVSGGSLVVGKTIKKATAGPALASAMSGATGTLSIPLAINVDGHIWWIPHGIYWPPATSSPLGAVVTSTSLPIGAMIPYHNFGGISPLGYTTTKSVAPGFQLCDGSVVIDPASPHFNPTRNPDGTPTLSYNSALDKFTPNVNGEHVTHSTAVTWNEGDYVINAGTRYVAIQAVPISILVTNTAYWQPESTYNNTSPVNPYNKYRKTTQNQGFNTYVRGNAQAFAASSASGYGGSNTKTLTTTELPVHAHNAGVTGGNNQSLDHSHVYSASNQGGNYERDGNAVCEFNFAANTAGANNGAGTHTHNFNTTNAGSGAAFNSEPRFHNAIYIVRIY